jgi:hypothetical protein
MPRLWVQGIKTPEPFQLVLFSLIVATALGSCRSCNEADHGQPDDCHPQPLHSHAWILTGVPTGISRSNFKMSSFRSLTQPCETRPGISSGVAVPWIPTKPPAGQSVSTPERALVPNATGP